MFVCFSLFLFNSPFVFINSSVQASLDSLHSARQSACSFLLLMNLFGRRKKHSLKKRQQKTHTPNDEMRVSCRQLRWNTQATLRVSFDSAVAVLSLFPSHFERRFYFHCCKSVRLLIERIVLWKKNSTENPQIHSNMLAWLTSPRIAFDNSDTKKGGQPVLSSYACYLFFIHC